MSYDELRTAQRELAGEIQELNSKLSLTISRSEADLSAKETQFAELKRSIDKNNNELQKLLKADPDLNARAYFKDNTYSHLVKIIDEGLQFISKARKERKEGVNDNNLNIIDQLLAQVASLSSEMSALKKQAAPGSDTSVGLERILLEMQMGRNPLKLQSFPSKDVQKSYPNWRSDAIAFNESNQMIDSVKVQHLKDACKGTDAEGLMSLLDVQACTFAEALLQLDNRYYIATNIIKEYVNCMIAVEPKSHKGQQDKHIKEVLDTFNVMDKNITQMCKASLTAKGYTIYPVQTMNETKINALMVALLLRSIDDNVRSHLSSVLNIRALEIPAYPDIIKALEKRFLAVQGTNHATSKPNSTIGGIQIPPGAIRVPSSQVMGKKCLVCSKTNHWTAQCHKLSTYNTSAASKWSMLKALNSKLCFKCLRNDYTVCNCNTVGKKCELCNSPHHKFLCEKYKAPRNTKNFKQRAGNVASIIARRKASCTENIIGTVLLNVQAKDGKKRIVRAMLDDGSGVNLITKSLANEIGSKLYHTSTGIVGINGQTERPKFDTDIWVNDQSETLYNLFPLNELILVDEIPFVLPSREVNTNQTENLNIKLADPTYNIPDKVEILLGVSTWMKIKKGNVIKTGQLMLQETIFGYVVQGQAEVRKCQTVAGSTKEPSIKDTLKQIFSYDLKVQEKNEFSVNHFKETFKRGSDGRAIVSLISNGAHQLGRSYNVCLNRNRTTFGKLNNSQVMELKEKFQQQQKEGIFVVCKDVGEGDYYVPFVLVRTQKGLRICSDASQKTTSGVSLNDTQSTGEKLQPDVLHQSLKWRMHRFGLMADISNMFLQIGVDERDCKKQRSLITFPNEEIIEIEYRRLLFGHRVSPFLAQMAISEIARQEEGRFPLAAEIMRNNVYIDDFLFSAPSEELLKEILQQLTASLKTAHFDLHKISSNSSLVLADLDSSVLNPKMVTKALGTSYDVKADVIFIETNVKIPSNITKRNILTVLASIFDIMGIVEPFTMSCKFILQRLWKNAKHLSGEELIKTWDLPVDEESKREFITWCEQIPFLKSVQIPRHFHFSEDNGELVGFCDASIKGLGAVVYLKTQQDGIFQFHFIASKGRVAPMGVSKDPNVVSVPRLELMSAVLLIELMNSIKTAIQRPNYKSSYFTDSETVLAQISNKNKEKNVFTANRLKIIWENSEQVQWFFINSEANMADLISRGGSVEELKQWHEGPKCMQSLSFKPSNKFKIVENVASIVQIKPVQNDWKIFNKYKSYRESLRIMAYILRAIKAFKLKYNSGKTAVDSIDNVHPPTAEEIIAAEVQVIKIHQQLSYPEEIKTLKKKEPILSGILKTLNCFIDEKGVIRASTRIQSSSFPYDERNPIITAPYVSNDLIASLPQQIIYDAHYDFNHNGILGTMQTVRQRFHIPYLRQGTRKVILKCLVCVRLRKQRAAQLMGNLPNVVFETTAAFTHVTLDLIGPLNIKTKERSTRSNSKIQHTEKCWVLIVVCFTTSAYHLEIVSDLSAKAFLKAFNNFICTRGLPLTIHSDQGTNLIKASKLIDDCYRDSIEKGMNAIKDECNSKRIKWIFNVAAGSHVGGKHERGVRSVRELMIRSIGSHKLFFSDLHAVLKKIEAILNSRPMTSMRDSNADIEMIITPGHAILGRPLNMLPTEMTITRCSSVAQAYHKITEIIRTFWAAFYKQHIQSLAHRTKWYVKKNNIKVNDLVLLVDESIPVLDWRKAVITQVYPDKTGLVRRVDLRTANQRITNRPIQKLVLISEENETEEEPEPVGAGEIASAGADKPQSVITDEPEPVGAGEIASAGADIPQSVITDEPESVGEPTSAVIIENKTEKVIDAAALNLIDTNNDIAEPTTVVVPAVKVLAKSRDEKPKKDNEQKDDHANAPAQVHPKTGRPLRNCRVLKNIF